MTSAHNDRSASSRSRSRRPATVWAAAVGAILVMSVVAIGAPPVSAVCPYEEGEAGEQNPYPPCDTEAPDTPATVPDHAPVEDGCVTTHDETLGTDVLKLLDQGIDFGDNTWLAGAPLGFASVQWSVECGFFTADVSGTLHLDGVRGRSGRIHVSFWNAGDLVETRHSRTRSMSDNGHRSWSVNLSSPADVHVTEVHVCTEISDDGVDFDSVNCKTRYLN